LRQSNQLSSSHVSPRESERELFEEGGHTREKRDSSGVNLMLSRDSTMPKRRIPQR
jgi:hypothetical protein